MSTEGNTAEFNVSQEIATPEAVLSRGTRALVIVLILSIVGFGIYYYVDRRGLEGPSLVDQTMLVLEERVKKDPNNADLRVQVALAYMERQMVDSAIAQYQAALELTPNHNRALLGLGDALLAKKDDDGALAAFQQVADQNKDNPFRKTLRQLEGVYYKLALIQERRGDLESAEANLLQALEIGQMNADVWYLLGEVRRQVGRPDEAVQAYNKAVGFDPRFNQAYEGMASVFARQGQAALADYANGMVALGRDDYQGALSSLRRSTEAEPNNADAYLGLGQAYEYLNREAEAVPAFENAVRLAPNNFLAQMFLQRGRDRLQTTEVQR